MDMGLKTKTDSEAACSIEAALKQLTALERMIEITSTTLVDLRGRSLTEFTIKEIRSLEGKLIKHFCQQLDTKLRIPDSNIEYPSLTKWLNVVGVSSLLAKGLQVQYHSVEDLMALSETQLQNIITELSGNAEDNRKLVTSLKQLKKFRSLQQQNRKNVDTAEVYWDSFSKPDDVFGGTETTDHDFNENVKNEKNFIENGIHDQSSCTSRHGSESSDSLPVEQQKLHRSRSNTDPSNTDMPNQFTELPSRQRSHQLPSTSSSCLTPPSPSGLGSRSSLESDSNLSVTKPTPSSSPPPGKSKIFIIPPSPGVAGTPPVTPGTPHKNSHYQVQNTRSLTRDRVSSTGNSNSTSRSAKATSSTALLPPFTPLKPSKSSEWHIGNRIFPNIAANDNISASNQSLSSIASTTSHKHKPSKKEKKRPHNLVITNADELPNFIHYSKPAASRRSSTTISPENAVSASAGVSPMSPRTPMTPMTPYNPEMMRMDISMSSRTPGSPQTPKSSKKSLQSVRAFFGKFGKKRKLKRPKSTEQLDDQTTASQPPFPSNPMRADSLPQSTAPPVVGTDSTFSPDENGGMFQGASYGHASSGSGDTSSLASMSRPISLVDTDRTLIPDTTSREESLINTITRQESELEQDGEEASTLKEEEDADEKLDTATMRANLFRQGSTIQSMSEEWDIPYSELQIGDKIGSGRVGTVFRGRWHGEVAIRVIDICHNDEEKLRAFKQEIMIYKKTRHENLELFMGSCMHPPHLAIVTGLCKGQSLYNHIRSSKYQTVNINHAKIIGQHIVQGMGYLHSKGIIHKDLKSKNIFVDGKHVVITDFGLVGLHAVSGDKDPRPGSLSIPDGWLCHLSPEVIKALRVPKYEGDEVISTLPYTIQSDVFAFGTVWYELMSGSWPFKDQPAESIIWQVGSGKKQNLSQLQGGKDIKDILMQSWSYDPSRRPDFSDNGIMGILKRLQSHIQRGNSDPSMICCDPLISSRGIPRYHPLLSPSPKNKSFAVATLRF